MARRSGFRLSRAVILGFFSLGSPARPSGFRRFRRVILGFFGSARLRLRLTLRLIHG